MVVLAIVTLGACSGLETEPGLIGRDCKRIRAREEQLEKEAREYERDAHDRAGPGGSRLTNEEAQKLDRLQEELRKVRSRVCY